MPSADILSGALEASWQASIGIVLLLAVRAVAGRFLSGRWLYCLWVIVMARLLLPGSILPASPASMPQPRGSVRPEMVIRSAVSLVSVSPVVGTSDSMALRGNAQERIVPESPAPTTQPINWRKGLIILWAAGAGVLAAYFLGAALWLHRRIQRGLRPTPEPIQKCWQDCRKRIRAPHLTLLTSEAVHSPLLFGLIKPKLVLPHGQLASLSQADWEHIFLHELTHHRRWDTWSNLLPLAGLCAHWFNPLVWLCQRAIRADRELATDEDVLRVLGGNRRNDYAQTLLRVLTSGGDSRLVPGAIGIVESGAGMKRRFRRILQFRSRSIIATVCGILVLCGLVVVTFAQEKMPAETAVAKSEPIEIDIPCASQQEVKDQILVAARKADGKKISAILTTGDKLHAPFTQEDANDVLEKLIKERDLKTFTFLLEKLRMSPCGKDWQPGETSLVELLKDNRRDFVEVLLNHRLKLDLLAQAGQKVTGPIQPWVVTRVEQVRTQRKNEDLLVKASQTGDITEMTRLLDAGVDKDCVSSNDFTPLTQAAHSGKAAAVRLLLSRSAQVDKPRLPGWDYTPLCLATTVEVAQLLKDAGANVNATLFGRPEPIITYPTRWASTDVVRWFLDHGVDARKVTCDEPSLLFSAGRPETAELLIQKGVDVHTTDGSGETALFQIARDVKNPANIIKVLLTHGADPNARNKYGQTPLMSAPDAATVEVLIAAGADVTAKDDGGHGVLQFSGSQAEPDRDEALRRHGVTMAGPSEGIELLKKTILSNDVARAKELLSRGVDPDALSVSFQQYQDCSSMALAAALGRFDILNAMRMAGGKDVGPLSQAAAEGDTEKMKSLIRGGAKVEEQTSMGQTPLSFAVRRGKLEAVRLLLDAGAAPTKFDRWGSTPLSSAEFSDYMWKSQGSMTPKQTGLLPKEEAAFYPQAVSLMEPHASKKEWANADGDTALTMASSCGNTMSAMMLIPRGANVNYQRPDGLTPLMIAIVTKPKGASKEMVTKFDPKTGKERQSSIAASFVEFLLS